LGNVLVDGKRQGKEIPKVGFVWMTCMDCFMLASSRSSEHNLGSFPLPVKDFVGQGFVLVNHCNNALAYTFLDEQVYGW
jgi:hypothetical protein